MTSSTLMQLEEKLDRLIQVCNKLQTENQHLRKRESVLVHERSNLLEKNESARSKVEAMISRLKNLDIEG